MEKYSKEWYKELDEESKVKRASWREKYKKENNSKILISKNLQWLNWLLGNHLIKKKAKIFVIQEKKKYIWILYLYNY